MKIVYLIVLSAYVLVLIYITLYCLMQFLLLLHYHRYHSKSRGERNSGMLKTPLVTIQLPMYNERYVAERLIDAICAFEYPKSSLQIQVLDDSTDDTVDLMRGKVSEYRQKGFDIELIHRKNRRGFKAGALKDAMPRVRGEFVAIFDADFLPNPDFLKKTMPYFSTEEVGVVQTRWEHINEDYSLLTKLQALQLNVHFTIEQQGRRAAKQMLQFNGTAGIWRKKTIEEAGGWSDDTLTEDLDLSIRAQLKGWKIHYLEEVGAPAELPSEMMGLKSQQFRWMKGGAETAKKMLPVIWRSSLPLKNKMHSTMHLLSSTVFLFVFILGVLSVPLLFALKSLQINASVFSYFIVGTASIICVYYIANVANPFTNPQPSITKDIIKFIFLFPVFLAMSMGLSLHNTIAVLQGYLGRKSDFVRTPKFNIKSIKDSFDRGSYRTKKVKWITLMEGLLCIYFVAAILYGMYIGDRSMMVFHIMLAAGYGSIFYYSVRHLSTR